MAAERDGVGAVGTIDDERGVFVLRGDRLYVFRAVGSVFDLEGQKVSPGRIETLCLKRQHSWTAKVVHEVEEWDGAATLCALELDTGDHVITFDVPHRGRGFDNVVGAVLGDA